MSQLSLGLIILFTIILIIGFVQTIRLGQTQGQGQESTIDSDISDVVKAHPYTRNPVFWAYIVGLALAFAYLIYQMF